MKHLSDGPIKDTVLEKPASIPKKFWDSLPPYVKFILYLTGIITTGASALTGAGTVGSKLGLFKDQVFLTTGPDEFIHSSSLGQQYRNPLGKEFSIPGTSGEDMILKTAEGVLAYKAWYETSLINIIQKDGTVNSFNAEVPIKNFNLSKNGKKLAFFSRNINNQETTKIINTKNLNPEATIEGGHPIFSPDSEKLAFTRYNPVTQETSLFIFENFDPQPIGKIQGELIDWTWHDQNNIIISSRHDGENILTLRNLHSLENSELFRNNNSDVLIRNISVSPDSKYVAFTSAPEDMSPRDSSFNILELNNPSNNYTVIKDAFVSAHDWGTNGHVFYNIPNGENSGLYGYNPDSNEIYLVNTALPGRSLAVIDH